MTSHAATDVPLADGVLREFLLHHGLCPIAFAGDGRLIVGAAPAAIRSGVEDLAYAYRTEITVQEMSRSEIERAVERLAARAERVVELTRAGESELGEGTTDVRELANQPFAIKFVNLCLRDAYDEGASDIHLEATRNGLAVRFRIDGVLVPAQEPPAEFHQAIQSRLKLMANLDIAEWRKPQDGRIRVRLDDRELDLRVSVVPTMFGQSIVIRLLDRGGRPVALEELGMAPSMLQQVERLALRPHGMLLNTGPTGSGKTTTLYAILLSRDSGSEKIITVEDPVEYQLDGITQTPVHGSAGVTFASALRNILRQDPDVIMIGEMRDTETAMIAVQAAMTGHLVFSTLHTNDAVSAIARLLDLGVPDYLVAATVEGVLAQRLVRRLCSECRVAYTPPAESIALLTGRPSGTRRLVRGAGCAACRGTGYRGRLGLFELLVMTDELKEAIVRRASRAQLRALALESGMVPLRADGWSKVEAELTTVEEVLRVAQD